MGSYLNNTEMTLDTLNFSTLKIAPMLSVNRPDIEDNIVLLATLVYARLAFVV